MRELGVPHNLDFLQYPKELSLVYLPSELKKICLNRLQNLHSKDETAWLFNNALDTVLGKLQQDGNKEEWAKCQNIIKSYNTIRPTPLGNIVPEFQNI